MLRPACEDGFHSLQVLNGKLTDGVFVLNVLNPLQADFLYQVYSEGNQVPRQLPIAANAA